LLIDGQGGTGVRPKVGDAFGDLLGSQGYNFTSTKDAGPRTINAMRKEEMARDMDPEKLKVCPLCIICVFIFIFDVSRCLNGLRARRKILGPCYARCTPFFGREPLGNQWACTKWCLPQRSRNLTGKRVWLSTLTR
jgi:hypothetical protein